MCPINNSIRRLIPQSIGQTLKFEIPLSLELMYK